MKFGNYLCEFILFRRLWSKTRPSQDKGSDSSSAFRNSVTDDFFEDNDITVSRSRNYGSDYSFQDSYERENPPFDDFDEEQDDYDMMDDF